MCDIIIKLIIVNYCFVLCTVSCLLEPPSSNLTALTRYVVPGTYKYHFTGGVKKKRGVKIDPIFTLFVSLSK